MGGNDALGLKMKMKERGQKWQGKGIKWERRKKEE